MGFHSAMDGASMALAGQDRSFDHRPWQQIDMGGMRDMRRVPTMLSHEEQQFYLWLCRDWMAGRGAVVDLGAFVGGSTARLAEGHRMAGHDGMIHAYDRFRADETVKARLLYANGVPPFAGSDAFRVARRLLAPWRNRIVLHQGEIQEIGWQGGPIELLVIDAFKRVDLVDRMVADFFPSLMPGHSIVVQQDLLHWSQPWLCALMARLGDAFTPLCHVPGECVAYRLDRPLTPVRMAAARLANITDAELLQSVRLTRSALSHWKLGAHFDAIERALQRNPGARVAWQMQRAG